MTNVAHVVTSTGATLVASSYTLDNAGNRTGMVEFRLGDAQPSLVTWTYDPAYQLTGEQRTGTPAWTTFTREQWSQFTPDQWAAF